ncbi:MAG: hypothetical protein ACJ75R_04690 [Solirubrobacterales bacterium]
MRVPPKRTAAALVLTLAAIPVVGCGGGDSTTGGDQSAPAASTFPDPGGRTIQKLMSDYPVDDNLIVAPSGSSFMVGKNRFGFGVFNVDQTQVADAEVALYAAPASGGPAQGPFPARMESLATDPAYVAQTTSSDPNAAKQVYVTEINFDQPGEWRFVALVKGSDGKLSSATLAGPVVVKRHDAIPAVGDKAPVIHTPTVDDVANVSQIDTRVPPDTMHDVDFADVVGKQPVVLLFATPALCQSRVCGPVVDVAEQVKEERPNDAAFIHMEIYNDNNASKGLRPQVSAYHLRTEPWLFVIAKDGKISTRIEGAFSVDELNTALDKVS